MFLKLLGSLLIIISASLFGWFMSCGYKLRLDTLNELTLAMAVFKGELSYSAPQLSDICYKAADKTKGEISRIFKNAADEFYMKHGENAADIWFSSVDNTKTSNLNYEDIEAIKDFGKSLGHPSREMQYEAVNILFTYIGQAKEVLQIEEKRNSRLFKSMSVLFGILVVVVLL